MNSLRLMAAVAGALTLGGVLATTCVGEEASLTPAQAKARMEAACLEVSTLRSNIYETLVLLDQARNGQQRQAQLNQFGTQLTHMLEEVQLVRARAQAMKQRGDAYFAEWEARTAGIQDPDQRRYAASRYATRKRSYNRILENLLDARANFGPLLSDLRQVQKLLETNADLTRPSEARDVFMHANWRCIDVQRCLMEVENEFTFLASDFAQAEK